MTRPRPARRLLTHNDVRLALRSMLKTHVRASDAALLSPNGLVFELQLLLQRLEERYIHSDYHTKFLSEMRALLREVSGQ